MTHPGRRLSIGTRVELVQSLFAIPIPAAVMTLCFAAAGAYILRDIRDLPLTIIYAAGLALSAIRMTILFGYRRAILSKALAAARVFTIEKRFAIGYFGFAFCFGLFSARAFVVIGSDLRVPIIALVYGYAAGIAATVSLRPWISLPSMVMAVVPIIASCIMIDGFPYWQTAILTVLFLFAALLSMVQRYRSISSEIAMRRLLETFARRDELTDLPNRLHLGEHFEGVAATGGPNTLIAVHRVDINAFWAINGDHGHVIGDEVLKAASGRLGSAVGQECLSVRLADDDFVVLQPDIAQPQDALIMAHRILAALDKPYSIASRRISVRFRIGYAVAHQRGADLGELISRADVALARAKHESLDVAGDRGDA